MNKVGEHIHINIKGQPAQPACISAFTCSVIGPVVFLVSDLVDATVAMMMMMMMMMMMLAIFILASNGKTARHLLSQKRHTFSLSYLYFL